MHKPTIFILLLLLFSFTGSKTEAQQRLINKMRDKVEDKIIDKAFDKDEKTEQQSQDQNFESESSSGSKNTKGAGLSSGPDVIASIDDASSAFKSSKYSDSRFSIKQAMQGIELEMGKEVLKSLPETVDGLDAMKDQDQVTSTGVGFVGLAIERNYAKEDRELEVVIANNSVWVSSVNMYLGSSTTGDEQHKQIKFQDNQGIIEYEEGSGYKLSVPFGQTSIIIIKGINFETEQKFMSACNEIKIETIKNKLGEQ